MSIAKRGRTRLANIEVARGLAALAVFGSHFLGDWAIRSGQAAWPPRFLPHIQDVLLRYAGAWGVSVFVILSGLVLVRASGNPQSATRWTAGRLKHTFPFYWWVAIPLIVLALLAGSLPLAELWQVPFWLSGTMILLPGRMTPVVDAWWYMTLLLQLYLVFPLIKRILTVFGAIPLAVLCLALNWLTFSLLERADAFLSPGALGFLRVAFIGSRIVEVAFGMTLGAIYWSWSPRSQRRPGAVYSAAASCSILAGYLFLRPYPYVTLLAVGFVAAALSRPVRLATETAWARPMVWLGTISFAFYLSHSPWAMRVIGQLASNGVANELVALLGSLAVALTIACAFHYSYDRLPTLRFLWTVSRGK